MIVPLYESVMIQIVVELLFITFSFHIMCAYVTVIGQGNIEEAIREGFLMVDEDMLKGQFDSVVIVVVTW